MMGFLGWKGIRVWFIVSFVSSFLFGAVLAGNIEPNGDGSYCINRIPKRAVTGKCSSTSECENLLGVALQEDGDNIRCGGEGECVSKQSPTNEQCREACGSSECGKFCLQEYETKTALYCIETRDHPNAMPDSSATPPNKYFCTCIIPESTPYQHRVASRYLRYKVVN